MSRKGFIVDMPAGFTAVEVLLVTSIAIALMTMAVPLTTDAVDRIRTGMAARYLEGRIMNARLEALKRSACVALRFEAFGGDYRFAEYVDLNDNGVRSSEIAAGIDTEIEPPRHLRDQFTDVSFGLMAGIPDIDGVGSTADRDGVRIGASRILTMGPDGTATSGTLYLHGRRAQYAVRILGATGRTRVLLFDTGSRQWVSR